MVRILDKNGCYRGIEYDGIDFGTASAHTITSTDVTQPDGTIKRFYKVSVPTLKLGDEGDEV